MRKSYFFLTFFLLFLSIAGAQDLKQADSLFNVSQFKAAERIYLIKRAKAIESTDWRTLAYCNIKLADIIRINGGNRLAIKLLEENDSIIINYTSEPFLISKNLIAKAEANYNLNNLGVFKALVDSSYTLKLSRYGKHSPELAEELLHKGRYELGISHFDKMLGFAQKARSVVAKNNAHLPRVFNLIAYSYHNLRSFKKAIAYYDSAKWALKYQNREDKLMLSKIYQNIGNTYNDQIAYDPKTNLPKALANYDKSIGYSNDFSSTSKMAMLCFVKQFAYSRAQNFDSAIVWLDKGIELLSPNFTKLLLDNKNTIERTLDDNTFLLLIETKANKLKGQYKITGDIKYLIESTKYYKYRFLFHQFLVANSTSDFETLHMFRLTDNSDIGAYLENEYELNRLNPDTNRLYEAFELTGIDKYGLTFKNLIKEYSITKDNDYENYLLQHEYETINSKIESGFLLQHYIFSTISHQSKKNNSTQSQNLFSPLYSQMTKNDAVIDYNTFGTILTAFILTKDSISLHRIELSDSIKSAIGNLRFAMKEGTARSYYKRSRNVFKELIEPIYPRIKDKNNWIIIQDSELGSVPFEALPFTSKDEGSNFKSIDYLINHHVISYAFTAYSIVNKVEESNGFLGFSPSFKNQEKLSALPFSAALLHKLKTTFNGDYYFEKSANIKSLFSTRKNPTILHIASHFKINENYPELTDMYAYNEEGNISTIQPLSILELPYTPELTILSGCQTGVGKSFAGEGSLSFGRYFMKLGSPSIITTLWEVDDKASKDVLSLFYKYLEAGEPKNIALHQAKLAYLANLNEHQTANPINWAGYILIGNFDSIKLDKKVQLWGFPIWYYLVNITLLSGVFAYFKKN